MPILSLVLACIFILCVEVMLFKVEYSSPVFIFTASFTMCAMCTAYLGEAWNIQEIRLDTFTLIITSIILFAAVDQLTRWVCLFLSGSKIKLRSKISVAKEPILVSKSVLYVSLAICVLCLVWTCYYILRFVGRGSLNAIMAAYKDTVNQNVASFGFGRKLLNQFMKVSTALNYLLLFIFNHNASCTKLPRKERVLYYLNFIAFMLFRMLLSGGRQGVLFFVIAWFTIYFISNTHEQSTSKVRKQQRKYILYIFIAICLIFPLFYFMGRMVGRKESEVLYAATAYLSTGIYGLEQEIKNHYSSRYWGEISFPGLYPLLKFLDVLPKTLESQSFLPFFNHGNTVSLLGRWYWDFGFSGVYIILGMVAFLFSWLYYRKIKYARDSHKRNFAIIVYGYCVHILYFAGYDDFFMNLPSLNFVLTMLILYMLYIVIIKYKVKFVWRK